MNALRRKLNINPGLPDNIKSNTAIWREIHNAICVAFSTLSHEQWEEGRIHIEFGAIKEMQYALAETALCFGYGDEDGNCTLLVHFDREFAARVSLTSLAALNNAAGPDYTPGNLDLILFKPVIECLEAGLGLLFANVTNRRNTVLRSVGQKLSPLDFDYSRNFDVWNEVTLNIRPSEIPVIKKPGGKSGPAATDKKKKGAGTGISILPLKILLPQLHLEKLMAANEAVGTGPVIDPENPWTAHMRRSVETASVPVRAIVETCRMTVADCSRFEIGQIIDLPGVSLQSIGLETDLRDGTIDLGPAELGIFKSHRAVKLVHDLDPDFRADAHIIEH